MKEIMGQIRRTLSILLAVTMVVTCIPQAGLTAKAVEPDAAGVVEKTTGEDISLANEDSNVVDEDIAIDAGEKDKEEEVVSDEEAVETPSADEQPANSEADGITNSEEDITDDAEKSVTADDVSAAETYDIDFDNSKAPGTSITLDATLEGLASVLTLDDENTQSVVEKAADQVVTFTVAGYTASEDEKLHVYYVVDGADDDRIELEADQDGRYTVPAAAVKLAEESVKIVLEVETSQTTMAAFETEIDAAETMDEPLTGEPIFLCPYVYPGDNGLIKDSVKVKTNDKVVQATTEDGFNAEIASSYYKIMEGATIVEVTVTAKAGYTLSEGSRESSMVKSVTEKKAEDGSTEYTIILLATEIEKAVDKDRDALYPMRSEADKFTAKIEPSESDEFRVEDFQYRSTIWMDVTGEKEIPYESSLSARITANEGCSLTSVTYTMGGDPVTVRIEKAFDEEGSDWAYVSIQKVTADVTINVASSKRYSLTDLTDADGNKVEIQKGDEEDRVYRVHYDTAYLVGVKYGGAPVPAENVRAVAKNAKGETVSMSTSVEKSDYLKIDFAANPELRGQDIAVEMYVEGVEEKVGTYVLSVSKATTKLEIRDAKGNKIDTAALTVGSRVEYTIDTDGTLDEESPSVTGDSGLIQAWIENDKLVIEMPAKDTAAVTGKTATITVKAKDNAKQATVIVTAKPLFDESKAPTVTKAANGAADTAFNVDIVMDLGEDFQEPYNGSLWYAVTATAKTDEEGKTFPYDKLKWTKTATVRRTGDSTSVKLEVGQNDLLGTGEEWDYEVTARLLYYDNKQGSGNPVARSQVGSADCGTIAPLFTTALKLKKGSDKVALYTGRTTESVIATIQWDNTKDKGEKFYKVADENIRDDRDGDEPGSAGLHFAVRGDQIVVTGIDRNAELGKHTITVLATADQTPGHEMYASRATIAVTVVKGINNIIITTPSTSIYKPAGTSRAATMKLGVDYNVRYTGQPADESAYGSWDGKKWVTTPKVKKVTWEIVSASPVGGSVPKNIADYVSVKNGTITVDKRFQVDPNFSSKNMFKVKVTAADYAGNETSEVLNYAIEITNEPTDISKLIIANYTGNGDTEVEVKAVHDITDENAVKISASDVDGGYVYALSATATVQVGDKFDYLGLLASKAVGRDKIAFASGNKKILEVNEYGHITVLTAGKKAAVKVTTTDGSNNKKTHTMNLTLDYKETAGSDLALGIWVRTADSGYADSGHFGNGMREVFDPTKPEKVADANTANVKETPVTESFTATGAARLYVRLYVGDGANAGSETYSIPEDVRYTNYKLAVKGGKFVTNANGTAEIITTARETTLTLTDQSPEAKKAKKKAYVYKLVNTAYAADMGKAPKVTVKNTLHEQGSMDEQTVKMAVNVTMDPHEPDRAVKVEMDWSARTDKNEAALNAFAKAIQSNIIHPDADGNITLCFWGNSNQGDNIVNLTPGSYKLKVTVGRGPAEDFTAETLPATVTVKVVKNKTATFKLNATYTISELDGAVILTGKSNLNAKAGEEMVLDFNVEGKGLKNANVKGKSNDFTKYFAVDQDRTSGTWRLIMTDELKAALAEENATMESVLGKNGLTGYISYLAKPNVSYYDESKLDATDVKITVKPAKKGKTGSTYKANNAEVGLTAEEGKNKTQIDIVANGEKVNVKYAAIDADPKKVSKEFEIDTETSATGTNANGQAVLKVKTDATLKENKSYTVNLKVVPADSYYAAKIDEAVAAAQTPEGKAERETTTETPETVESLIQRYGITVKVSVKAVSSN